MTARLRNKVLILDDDPDICLFFLSAAGSAGLECETAASAAEFFDLLTPEHNILFIDLVIPQIDGIEVLRELGRRNVEAKIVLISAVSTSITAAAKEMAERLGLPVIGCLQKPFNMSQLVRFLVQTVKSDPQTLGPAPTKLPVADHEVLSAIKERQYEVHYQPIMEAETGRLLGVEALVRWTHPKHGMLLPRDFIHRLEELSLIDELTWFVANASLRDLSTFSKVCGRTLRLSLNVAAVSLRNLLFPDILAAVVDACDLKPAQIVLQIKESGLIKDLASSLDVLARLRLKHFQISIDDFGTGYSMMQQLRTIPATELKIDKGFVKNIGTRYSDRVMVQKTIEIGHALGLTVVAEGVDAAEQLDFLRANRCDLAQGHLFSRPMPAYAFRQWLQCYTAVEGTFERSETRAEVA